MRLRPALLAALGGRSVRAAVAYGVPVAAFLASLAAAVYGKTLPAPALMLFDVYLIALSAVRLAAPSEPEEEAACAGYSDADLRGSTPPEMAVVRLRKARSLRMAPG